ncbi:MAG: hypothetical protein ABFD80_07445 [Acidobacteriota bacterium]
MTREIRLPAPHPRFRPRLEGGLRRPGHPGTTIRIGEDLFEVVSAERSEGEWAYRLEPWPEQETIRACVAWGEEAERDFIASLRDDRIRRRKDFFAWGAQAFLGFLPAEKQEQLSQTRGLDPTRATLWSAVLETAVALPFAVVFVINLAAGGMAGLGPVIPGWAGAPALVLAAEGIFRLAAVVSTGSPIGSLLLAILGLRLKSDGPRYVPSDEILTTGDAMTVVSPVPKVWWERAGGVTYLGESYIWAGSDREKAKYLYRFRKGGKGFPMLDPELEKVRNRSSDLSYVLAPLWGFLPADFQRALEFYGRYRPRPYVVLSICFNVLAALAMIGPGLRNSALGVFEIGSLLRLAAGLALSIESILRILRLTTEGRISGSFLACLIKPFYRLAIRDKPVPPGPSPRGPGS